MAQAGRAASLSRRPATERGRVLPPRYTHADSDRSRFQSSERNSEEIASVLSTLGRRTFWTASIRASPRNSRPGGGAGISPQPSVSMSLIFAKMFSTRRHFTIAARVKVLAARDKRRCLRAHCPPLALMAISFLPTISSARALVNRRRLSPSPKPSCRLSITRATSGHLVPRRSRSTFPPSWA
jgi:hypothetical protein